MYAYILALLLCSCVFAQNSNFTKPLGTPVIVRVNVQTEVAMLLDNVPSSLYTFVVNKYMTIGKDFWIERAKRYYCLLDILTHSRHYRYTVVSGECTTMVLST